MEICSGIKSCIGVCGKLVEVVLAVREAKFGVSRNYINEHTTYLESAFRTFHRTWVELSVNNNFLVKAHH